MLMIYLRGTSNPLFNFRDEKSVLVGYTYLDMVGDVEFGKSTSGFLITFIGGAVA